MDTTKCKSCGAEMMMVKSAKSGKILPLDTKTPVYSVGTDGADSVARREHGVYVSHFSTCPHATRHHKATNPGKASVPASSGYSDDTVKMPFGKYRGAELGDIPVDYLKWVSGQKWLKPDLKTVICAFLDSQGAG